MKISDIISIVAGFGFGGAIVHGFIKDDWLLVSVAAAGLMWVVIATIYESLWRNK
jgi:hypothetical protein